MNKLFFKLIFVIFFFLFINNAYGAIAISPLKYEISIKQGESNTKKVKITNEGNKAITLYTSAEDFISGDSSGKPVFIKSGEENIPGISLVNWVNINEKNITLGKGETREVSFTVSVPKNGEPGGHYGAIFFSPGILGEGKVAFSQRIGILLLIDVPGKIVIDGNLEKIEIGNIENDTFVKKNNFSNLPIQFNTYFKNKGNIHLKPRGKIELIDENGKTFKNIGKENITSPSGTFVGEKLVDYIPINDIEGNVLPKSDRIFHSKWEGFGYSILNEDGTKSVKFKNITEYYEDKAKEKQAYLMFWEQIHTKKVIKNITAKYDMYYQSKDKKIKDFSGIKTFTIEFNQNYVGLNYYVMTILVFIVILIITYIFILRPKLKIKKEIDLRKKIIEEMKADK